MDTMKRHIPLGIIGERSIIVGGGPRGTGVGIGNGPMD